jgi:effector-binding domain-containing protein
MLYEDDVPNVEVGVEVAQAITAGGRIVASALPAGRAATTVHRGEPSPEGLDAAHAAVLAWCEANGHARTGVRWEVYDHWRDDPSGFETAVYWLLTP